MGEVEPLKKDKSNKTAKKVSKIIKRKEFLTVVKISFARTDIVHFPYIS